MHGCFFSFRPFVGLFCLSTGDWSIHDLELGFRRQLLDGEALKETHPWWTPTLMTGQVCQGLTGSDPVMTTLTKVGSMDPMGANLQALPRGIFPSAHDIMHYGLARFVPLQYTIGLGPSGPLQTKILGLDTITLLSYILGYWPPLTSFDFLYSNSERDPVRNLASTYGLLVLFIVCVFLSFTSQKMPHHRGGLGCRAACPVYAHALVFKDHTTSKTGCLLVRDLRPLILSLPPWAPSHPRHRESQLSHRRSPHQAHRRPPHLDSDDSPILLH